MREGKWTNGATLGNTIIENNDPKQINISRSFVDSNGPTNRFERPLVPSKTFTQTGIVWLTSLQAGVSAERSKIIKLANGRFVALWEEWNYAGKQLTYSKTKAIIINEQAQTLAGPVEIKARLNPSGADKPFLLDGKAAWMTGDASTGKYNLYTVDTNLVFSSAAIDPSGLPSSATFIDHLSAGDLLRPNDKLVSNNGRYKLVYQTDGNLALYAAENKFIWNTGTKGPAGYASMQSDGNFAIYTANGSFQWNTGTVNPGSRLVLQDDGNLVIMTATGQQIWASNTAQAQTRDRLKSGEKLIPGEKIQSPNGTYTLVYQTDSNLVLYKSETTALWSSGTNGRAQGYAIMQTDGNLCIYDSNDVFQWNTGTTTSGSTLVLQNDGNLVIVSPNGSIIWSSGTAP